MLIFREFFKAYSDQNIHQNAPNCTIFSKFAHEPPSIMRATIINMYFYIKIAIFNSRLFQNTHQNASIVKYFQIFLLEIYHLASVYLKYLLFTFSRGGGGGCGSLPRTSIAKHMVLPCEKK